jgi:hypothetical protein
MKLLKKLSSAIKSEQKIKIKKIGKEILEIKVNVFRLFTVFLQVINKTLDL